MNPQAAYDLLISVSNYLLVKGEYRAGDKIRTVILAVLDANPKKIKVRGDASEANLNRWQYIRALERAARKAVA